MTRVLGPGYLAVRLRRRLSERALRWRPAQGHHASGPITGQRGPCRAATGDAPSEASAARRVESEALGQFVRQAFGALDRPHERMVGDGAARSDEEPGAAERLPLAPQASGPLRLAGVRDTPSLPTPRAHPRARACSTVRRRWQARHRVSRFAGSFAPASSGFRPSTWCTSDVVHVVTGLAAALAVRMPAEVGVADLPPGSPPVAAIRAAQAVAMQVPMRLAEAGGPRRSRRRRARGRGAASGACSPRWPRL
jgi:hypothetical protein